MAELTINADEIAAALRDHVGTFTPSLEAARVGRVLEVGDGIARVAGLPETAVNELLEFEGGALGLALNLDEASIGAVVLGGAEGVEEGHAVKATGRILSVPVGDALIGRVVNALGQPIDGKGPIQSDEVRRLEVQAPGIVGRKPVHEPLQTGIKSIDAMTPEQWKVYDRLLLVDPPKELAAYKDLETIDFDVSFDQMRAASKAAPLPPIPFIVISKGKPFEVPPDLPSWLPATLEQAWAAGQSELAQLLPNTPHRTATKSSHYVQIEEPQLVIDAVRQVVEAARAEKPPR
jgi:pimeloyl-ACP methyl ester carboxylesterase